MDTGGEANWALRARPVSPRRGFCPAGSSHTPIKGNCHGKDRHQHEHLARRRCPGPGRQGGLPAGGWFLAFGGKDLKRGARSCSRRRSTPRPCCSAGAATSGSPRGGFPDRRVGGPAEQPAQVRRLRDPATRSSGATGRCSTATSSSEVSKLKGEWTVTSLSTPAISSGIPSWSMTWLTSCGCSFTRSCSGPGAPVRRDQRQKPMRLVRAQTIGDGLAFLTYERARNA